MVKAGVSELVSYNSYYDPPEDAVKWIYEAMEEARRLASLGNQ
jgi:hypothetical protein